MWKLLHENDSIKITLTPGFHTTGIVPLNGIQFLKKLLSYNDNQELDTEVLNDSVIEYLKSIRNPEKNFKNLKIIKKKLNIEPGKSISSSDLQTDEAKPSISKNRRVR